MKFLDKRIVKYLSQRLDKTEGTIEKDISNIGQEYSNCTMNARAQIYARRNGVSVRRFLDKEDKTSLPTYIEVLKPVRVLQQRPKKSKERIIQFVKYPTQDPFRKAHIEEVNRAYTYKCYTSALVICRKIIENLLIDILRLKFPENTRENKELYYDIGRGQIKGLKELLENLQSKKEDFEIDKKLVEKILSCVHPIKEDLDQKVHSWYHVIKTKAEIDRMDVQNIFDLFYELESKIIQQRNLDSEKLKLIKQDLKTAIAQLRNQDV